MNDLELMKHAIEARKLSYSPYSHFQVGAALLTKDGKVYTGCNIENAAYSPGNCAERTAFFCAVKEGERSFDAIAVVGAPEGQEAGFAPPCGMCRQVMREFCDPETFRILVLKEGKIISYMLKDLLPESFGPEFL